MAWIRKARVTFEGGGGFVVNPGGKNLHELRVAFSVSRGISGSPNEFEIRLWNLNRDHRNSVGRELDKVTLEAGYIDEGNIGVIAKGRIRDVQHDRDGPDIITTVSCGDGDKAFRRATISKTIPKGTSVKDVVEELYKEMEKQGIDRGEWKFPDDIRTLKRPYSMCGSCTREMDVLGRGNKFYWSIQNETLEIIPGDGYLPGAMVTVSARNGMVGTPTITDNGVKVRTLLNPQIRPNRLLRVESEVLEMNGEDGTYRISAVDFDGDNQEGDFLATIHGESLSGGKVNEGVKK